MIKGDTRRFSRAWVTYEILGLVAAWVLVWLHLLPRLALVAAGGLVLFGLLVEISRYYRRPQ